MTTTLSFAVFFQKNTKMPELVIEFHVPVYAFVSFFFNVFIPISKGKEQIDYNCITID